MKIQTLGVIAAAAHLAAVVLTGCSTPSAKTYQSSVNVRPAGFDHYIAEFKIMEGERRLAVPTILVTAANEGMVCIGGEKENNGVVCTVLVTENDNGVEATTTVTIKDEGKNVYLSRRNHKVQ